MMELVVKLLWSECKVISSLTSSCSLSYSFFLSPHFVLEIWLVESLHGSKFWAGQHLKHINNDLELEFVSLGCWIGCLMPEACIGGVTSTY